MERCGGHLLFPWSFWVDYGSVNRKVSNAVHNVINETQTNTGSKNGSVHVMLEQVIC